MITTQMARPVQFGVSPKIQSVPIVKTVTWNEVGYLSKPEVRLVEDEVEMRQYLSHQVHPMHAIRNRPDLTGKVGILLRENLHAANSILTKPLVEFNPGGPELVVRARQPKPDVFTAPISQVCNLFLLVDKDKLPGNYQQLPLRPKIEPGI